MDSWLPWNREREDGLCARGEDNHCETLQANIDAARYRNNGQTRRDNAMPRAYITLSCLCLDSCTRVQQRSIVLETERERGEWSSSISGKSVFHQWGERGFVIRGRGVFPDPSMAVLAGERNGIPVLLAIFCAAGADTRPKGNLFARETRAIDCNCVFGSVMAIGYGKLRVAGG